MDRNSPYITIIVVLAVRLIYADTFYVENWHLGANGPTKMSRALGFGPDGNLYVAEDTIISRIAPTRQYSTFLSDATQIRSPSAIAFDANRNLITVDTKASTTAPLYSVRKISPSSIAELHPNSDGINLNGNVAAESSIYTTPIGVAADSNGNLYFTDRSAGRVVRLNASGFVSDWASIAVGTQFSDNTTNFFPTNLSFDIDGNLIVTDAQNRKVWNLSSDGKNATLILAVASNTPATLYSVIRLGRSDLYLIADYNYQRIMRFNRTSGIMTDIIRSAALNLGTFEPSSLSLVYHCMGLVADNFGNIFFTEGHGTVGYRVRRAIRCGYPNSQWNNATRTCSCTNGTAFNLNSYSCAPCPTGQSAWNGVCRPLCTNETLEDGLCNSTCPATAVCSPNGFTCNLGYKTNFLGDGCEACPVDQQSSEDRRSCIPCDVNMYRPSNSSTCIRCPADATCSGGEFICNTGFEFNPATQQCSKCAEGSPCFRVTQGNISLDKSSPSHILNPTILHDSEVPSPTANNDGGLSLFGISGPLLYAAIASIIWLSITTLFAMSVFIYRRRREKSKDRPDYYTAEVTFTATNLVPRTVANQDITLMNTTVSNTGIIDGFSTTDS